MLPIQYVFVRTQKWFFTWFSQCYHPMTSLSTLHGNTLCAYFHSEESNIPLFILNRRNRSPSSLHLDTTTAVTFRRTIISLSAAEDFDFDANKLRSERCPIFNFFFPPMNRGALLDGLLGSAHHYRKKKKEVSRWCFALLSWGQTLLNLLGIPGRAETFYQAEQVRCKVGARGQSVSRWIPNATLHPNPKRWGKTLKLESPEKVEGWVGGKKIPAGCISENFINYWKYCWLLQGFQQCSVSDSNLVFFFSAR